MVDHLEQVSSGQGRCVLINGEAGVGKTRLIQELIAVVARRSKAPVLQGRCDELGLSYQPWAEAVREGLDKLKREDLQAIPPLWLAEVAKLVPELRTRMPELPENPALPPPQEQSRFFEGVTQLFLSLVASRGVAKPIILFLDDLHWADDASLDFLSFFLPRIEAHPVLVLGCYRSEEVRDDHALLRLVQTGEPQNLVYVLSLTRLAVAHVGELVSKLPLKVKHPELFSGRLYQETKGNPLFLIATLQHLFEEGAPRVEGHSWVTDMEEISANYKELMIPPSVKELMARRLSRLSEPEEKLLRLASVIGRDFELPLLERAWEGDGECLFALANLTKAHLLLEHRGHYEFSHDKIRETVYEEMSLPRRQLLHQRVMQALERFYAGRWEDGAALLAHHAYRAREWKKTLEYAAHALKRAVKAYHLREGLKLVELGLEAAGNIELTEANAVEIKGQEFKLLSQRVEIFDLQVRPEEAERDLARMHELAEQLGEKNEQALVLRKKSDLCRLAGKYLEAMDTALQALALYREIGNKQGQGACLNGIGIVYHSLGRYEQALSHYQQSLELRQEINDRSGHGASLNNIGLVYDSLGRYEEALCHYQQALELFQEVGHRLGQGASLNNTGLVYAKLGKYQEALHHYQQTLEIRKEIGDRSGQGDSLNNIGSVYYSLGRWEEALRHYQQAVEISKEIRDRWIRGNSLSHMGHLYYHLGRYEEALRCHQETRAIFAELGTGSEEIESLSQLGIAYLGCNEKDQALTHSTRAIEMLEDGTSCERLPEIFLALPHVSCYVE